MQARPAPVKSGGSHPKVPGVAPSAKPPAAPPKMPTPQAKSPAAPAAKGPPSKKVVFRFPCDKCKAMIQADSSHIGLMIVCPQCKHDMTVPEPS